MASGRFALTEAERAYALQKTDGRGQANSIGMRQTEGRTSQMCAVESGICDERLWSFHDRHAVAQYRFGLAHTEKRTIRKARPCEGRAWTST